jgi:Asp-tRNA(Asn)/Glu-tRNA(Gln) amidotransferase A subunit family amidase
VTVRIANQQQLVAAISERLVQDDALRQDVAAAFTKILHDLESQPVTIVSIDRSGIEVVEADSLYELLGTQPADDDIDWMAEKIRTDPAFCRWTAEDIAHAMKPPYPSTTDQESFDQAIRTALVAVARSWGVVL